LKERVRKTVIHQASGYGLFNEKRETPPSTQILGIKSQKGKRTRATSVHAPPSIEKSARRPLRYNGRRDARYEQKGGLQGFAGMNTLHKISAELVWSAVGTKLKRDVNRVAEQTNQVSLSTLSALKWKIPNWRESETKPALHPVKRS